MLVAMDLAATLGSEDDNEEDEDGHSIWPAPKKPCLLPLPWQSLPSDLLFHSVLVCLPFSVLLKLRSVSRSWRQRLSSHDFWFIWFQGNSNPNSIQDVSLNPNLLQKPSHSCNQNTICNPHSILNPIGNGMRNVVLNHRNCKRNPIPNHRSHAVLDSIILKCGAKPNNCGIPCLLLCSARPKASIGGQTAHWLRRYSIRYVQQQDGATGYRISQYWSQLHDESFMQVQQPYIVLASDGGLLLLATGSEGSQKLVVCNPLLRAHKVICDSDMSIMAVCFIVDKQRGEYRVFLANGSCQVYNSSTGEWQMIPTELFKDSVDKSPPILDGSYFWLSHPKMPMFSNGESTLFAYHADTDVVTCVRTRFPQGVSFPNHGHVWKDSYGLQTLAWSSTWFGTWKLDNGLWKCDRVLPFHPQSSMLSTLLNHVRVDSLLFLRFFRSNQIFVFDFGLDKGCWTPPSADSEYLTGHCVFQPSWIRV